MTDAVPLTYRAITSEDPSLLWEMVKEACSQGYVQLNGNGLDVQSLVDHTKKTTLFMRVVINYKLVHRGDPRLPVSRIRLFYGDASHAFSEQISLLTTVEGWKLHGMPVLYWHSGKPTIRQMLSS